ncbi:Rho- BTB domain-containing protein 2 [Serendipita sp. 399]|nr:Rho- BTB domain-containing protein 2 [Serendipita sp. 399]
MDLTSTDESHQCICDPRTFESIFSGIFDYFHPRSHRSSQSVGGPVQIHIEHLFRLYLLHIHDTDGTHPPATPPLEDDKGIDGVNEQNQTTRNPSDEVYDFNQDSDEYDDSDEDYHFGEDSGQHSITMREEQRRWKSLSKSSRRQASGRARWVARRIEYGLADIILICFSLADRSSFEHVQFVWRREIQQLCPHVPFMVVGLKLDLRRPDPTTPAALPSRKRRSQPPSQQTGSSSSSHLKQLLLYSRRPKLTRSSTTSTTAGEASTTTTSPSTSSFGHQTKVSSSSGVGGSGVAPAKAESDVEFDSLTSRFNQPDRLSTSPNRSTFPSKLIFSPAAHIDPVSALKAPLEGATEGTPLVISPSSSPPRDNAGANRPKPQRSSTFGLGTGLVKTFRRKSVGIPPTKTMALSDSSEDSHRSVSHVGGTEAQNIGLSAATRSEPLTIEERTEPTTTPHTSDAHLTPTTNPEIPVPVSPTIGRSPHPPSAFMAQTKSIGNEQSADQRQHPPQQQNRHHPSLPPFMRSFSQHATVIRRVISRSRSRGTTMTESPVTDTDDKMTKVVGVGGSGDSSKSAAGTSEVGGGGKSSGQESSWRPALTHRATSGSADQEVSSVRKLESRVRTTSQPSPTRQESTSNLTQSRPNSNQPPKGIVVLSDDENGKGKGPETTSREPRTSTLKTEHGSAKGGTRVTRIAEPPMSERRRRTTAGSDVGGDDDGVRTPMAQTTSYDEAKRLAREIGASGYMECSALTLVNVVKVFDEAVRIADLSKLQRRLTAPSSRIHGGSKRDDDCVIV